MQELTIHVTRSIISCSAPQRFLLKIAQLGELQRLFLDDQIYDLERKDVHIIGFGKATIEMFLHFKMLLGNKIQRSFLSVPYSTPFNHVIDTDPSCTVARAAKGNLPDDNTVRITRDIVEHVKALGERDLCICLISGGGSALLCDPIIPLPDLLDTINILVSRSATIQQLNTVRTYLCLVKGGGLAAYIHPATTVSLIISDVIGDPLQFIASGPTVPYKVTGSDVIDTLNDLKVSVEELPLSVQNLVRTGHVTDHVLQSEPHNFIIASNSIAMQEAGRHVSAAGFTPVLMSSSLCGEAREVADELIDSLFWNGERDYTHIDSSMVHKIRKHMTSGEKRLCFIWGGETTVTIVGDGVGGRCQEMGLAALISLGHHSDSTPLSVTVVVTSTDGQDGPTDASGVIVTMDTAQQASDQSLSPIEYLGRNDSYSFFSKLNSGDNLLKSGLTGTNLMDLVFIYVEYP